jgi:hypothetical protein
MLRINLGMVYLTSEIGGRSMNSRRLPGTNCFVLFGQNEINRADPLLPPRALG